MVDYSGTSKIRERDFQAASTEATELVDATGGNLVSTETSRHDKLHPTLFIGIGKTEELVTMVKRHNVELAMFSHEFTSTQERSPGKEL